MDAAPRGESPIPISPKRCPEGQAIARFFAQSLPAITFHSEKRGLLGRSRASRDLKPPSPKKRVLLRARARRPPAAPGPNPRLFPGLWVFGSDYTGEKGGVTTSPPAMSGSELRS